MRPVDDEHDFDRQAVFWGTLFPCGDAIRPVAPALRVWSLDEGNVDAALTTWATAEETAWNNYLSGPTSSPSTGPPSSSSMTISSSSSSSSSSSTSTTVSTTLLPGGYPQAETAPTGEEITVVQNSIGATVQFGPAAQAALAAAQYALYTWQITGPNGSWSETTSSPSLDFFFDEAADADLCVLRTIRSMFDSLDCFTKLYYDHDAYDMAHDRPPSSMLIEDNKATPP